MDSDSLNLNNLDKNKKRNIIIAAAVIVLVGGAFYFFPESDESAPLQPSAKKDEGYKPLPPPEVQTDEREFEVLSVVKDDTYHVSEVKTKKEFDLFIPSDAEFTSGSIKSIKKGTIIKVEKYMVVSNGIITTKLGLNL